eukprot:12896778-Prorocentrum_lima.AAC.1
MRAHDDEMSAAAGANFQDSDAIRKGPIAGSGEAHEAVPPHDPEYHEYYQNFRFPDHEPVPPHVPYFREPYHTYKLP